MKIILASRNAKKIKEVRQILSEFRELSDIEGVRVNAPVKSAPHIISLTVFGIRSETLLHFMSSRDIFISSGSACSSNSASKHSEALSGFGLENDEADSTVRISLSYENTANEAMEFISALRAGISQLAKKQ